MRFIAYALISQGTDYYLLTKEVYTCDECVDLCHEILEKEFREDGKN